MALSLRMAVATVGSIASTFKLTESALPKKENAIGMFTKKSLIEPSMLGDWFFVIIFFFLKKSGRYVRKMVKLELIIDPR